VVIVNYGRQTLIEDSAGNLVRCVARRGLEQIVCGDEVEWLQTGSQEGVVEKLAPRRSVLNRADSGNKLHPLVANFDQLLIEAAQEPALDLSLLDKYTIAAELAHTAALIVINKSDLLTPKARSDIEAQLGDYTTLGYVVLFTSALHNTGIEAFADCLPGRTSILVGQSGVGKSSLINRLLPDRDITVGRLSMASGLGRHTTTATTLYHLPCGGRLIDSPGVRDFRLGEVSAAELGSGFREFTPYLGQCRFNDCRHVSEPGCAVLAALAAGRISTRRMESYRRLLPA
jgi:ribosome biogenesis GTPase / thiamine phosphate phosphatase